MDRDFKCSQMLRAVGQLLEPLQLDSFALRVENDGIFVRAQKHRQRQATPPPDVSLRDVWQLLRSKKVESVDAPQPSLEILERRYTQDEISRMDSEGRSQRKTAAGRPDAYAVSQILRAVGAFVDQKQGCLLGVTNDGTDIAIEFESALKQRVTEKYTVPSLYDYWVKMYLRRRERS